MTNKYFMSKRVSSDHNLRCVDFHVCLRDSYMLLTLLVLTVWVKEVRRVCCYWETMINCRLKMKTMATMGASPSSREITRNINII